MIHMQDVMAKPMPDFREGSIVKGRILEVRPREVLVDVGYKSEGVIPLAEFDDVESLEVGDEVDVLLERLENDEGMEHCYAGCFTTIRPGNGRSRSTEKIFPAAIFFGRQ